MTMASSGAERPLDQVASQPGSTAKKWNREELQSCGAVGTISPRKLDLQGEIHPVFANWVKTGHDLRLELEQPLLLATKILEAAGIPWLSDFLIDDIFDPSYPGRGSCCSIRAALGLPEDTVPQTIVRHQRAPWVTPEMKAKWLDLTNQHMRNGLARSLTWEIDGEMFQEKGWVGYTCRHPRGGMPLNEVDRFETIERFDFECENQKFRRMSILLMAEYPRQLAELRSRGRQNSEEYLLTAFMTAVTILHEFGHVAYWKNTRSLTQQMAEPFYGADLEMELGDSFIASIFGGYVPFPIRDNARLRQAFSFEDGLCWRQALSWDYHRLRPKFRAHYSVSVDHIARLFTQASWTNAQDPTTHLIQPQALVRDGLALKTVGLHPHLSAAHQHATAAIANFHPCGDGYVWNRRPGAVFRIPQYDGYMCPDIALPVAAEDVIREPAPRLRPASGGDSGSGEKEEEEEEKKKKKKKKKKKQMTTPMKRASTLWQHQGLRGDGAVKERRQSLGQQTPSPRRFPLATPTRIPKPMTPGSSSPSPKRSSRRSDISRRDSERMAARPCSPEAMLVKTTPLPPPQPEEEDDIPRVQLGRGGMLSPDRVEISVDELKKRLSVLIGVSMTELEMLFEQPQYA
ncbi:hypothetical protein F5Y15DRAFT_299425 [Xylariaceae sp. FL0016]|nr:hypothetical protein F5Y15DRAFT_299425 [Xylariaceae sp. FL0016]